MILIVLIFFTSLGSVVASPDDVSLNDSDDSIALIADDGIISEDISVDMESSNDNNKLVQMIRFLAPFYCTYIGVEVFSGVLRGMGSALVPMLITLSGICLLRVSWILLVFPTHKTIETV